MVRIGRVLRASGLGGDLRIQLFRPRRSHLQTGDANRLVLDLRDGSEREVVVKRARFTDSSNAVVHVEGITDRTEAEALEGAFVRIDPAAPPPLLCDEADRVVGSTAIAADDGRELGRVIAVEDNGAQALLVIEASSGEVLVPFVDAFVVRVEVGRVVLNVLEGLFE